MTSANTSPISHPTPPRGPGPDRAVSGRSAAERGSAPRANQGGTGPRRRFDRLPGTVADGLLRPRYGAGRGHRARRPGDPRAIGRRRTDGRGAGVRRRVAATSLLQHGPVRRGRAGRPPAPQGLSADLRTVRRATLLRRRRAVPGLRHGPLRPDGHPDLRGFLAPFGRRHHAGRRDRRARSAPRTRPAAASRDRGSARPRPTSICRRPTPN